MIVKEMQYKLEIFMQEIFIKFEEFLGCCVLCGVVFMI